MNVAILVVVAVSDHPEIMVRSLCMYISKTSGDLRAGYDFTQLVSIAVQLGNAASILRTSSPHCNVKDIL